MSRVRGIACLTAGLLGRNDSHGDPEEQVRPKARGSWSADGELGVDVMTMITAAVPARASASAPEQGDRYAPWEAGVGLGAFAGGVSAIRHAAPVTRHATMKFAAPAAGAVAALGLATGESAAVRALMGDDPHRERLAHAGIAGTGGTAWLAMKASGAVSRSPALSAVKTGAALLGAASAPSLAADGGHSALEATDLGAATAPAIALAAGGAGLLLMHRPPRSMAAAVAKEAEYARIMRERGATEMTGQVKAPFEPEQLLPSVPWDPAWTGQIGYRAAREAVPRSVITHIMGVEDGLPHLDPVRVVVPFEAADTNAARAALGLKSLDEQDFLERAVLYVDNPAGGSVSRPQVEAAELLTRGDMASISVAFAKKPAIDIVKDPAARAAAVETQRLVLEGVRKRIDSLPPDAARPQVVFASNSVGNLGANNVFYEGGMSQRARYGIDKFAAFGVPSLAGELAAVSDDLQRGIPRSGAIRYASAEEFARIPAAEREQAWQHVVTNYDDQVQVRLRDIWMKPPVPARAEDPAIGPWIPLVSALRRVEDVLQLGAPRPGVVADRAHMHTKVAPFAMRQVLGDSIPPVSDEQLRLIEDYGRRSELARYGMGPNPVFDEPFPHPGRPRP